MDTKVIIGYSKHFRSSQYFEEKVSNTLSSLQDAEIFAIADTNSLISRYSCNSPISRTISSNAHPREIRKFVKDATHAIFFWDGTDIDQFIYYALQFKLKLKIYPVETTKVANKDKGEPFEIYIGRGTPWGNPYPIGDGGMTRDEVIAKFREYFKTTFLSDPKRLKELMSLKGRILGCHCKPYPCHGDVIAEYFNSTVSESDIQTNPNLISTDELTTEVAKLQGRA